MILKKFNSWDRDRNMVTRWQRIQIYAIPLIKERV
jgi:hypothetical protein